MWQINSDTVITWNYQEGDEFNGKEINKDYWGCWFGWGRAILDNKEQQYYSNWKNHYLDNGKLCITTKQEKITERFIDWQSDNDSIFVAKKFYSLNKMNFNYSSGMIQSVKKFNKGYFECRFKTPKQSGYWPAFWLYGGSPNEEIDMLEGKTERQNQVHIDTHCPNRCDLVNVFLQKRSYGGWVKTKYNFTEGYNIIACDWDTDKIKFYLNGECIGVSKVKFDAEKQLVFNTAVPSNNGPFKPGPSKADTSTAVFEIDYVRVWNKSNIDSKLKNPSTKENYTNMQITTPIITESMSRSKGKLTYGEKDEHADESVFISCFDNEKNIQLYTLGVFTKGKPTYTIESTPNNSIISGTINDQIFTIEKSTLAKGNYNLVIKTNTRTVAKNFVVN